MDRLLDARAAAPKALTPQEADRIQVLRGPTGSGKSYRVLERTATLQSQGYRVLRIDGAGPDAVPAVLRALLHSDLTGEPAVAALRGRLEETQGEGRDLDVTGVWALSDALRGLRREHRIAVALDDVHLLDDVTSRVLPAFLVDAGQPVALTVAVDGDATATPSWPALLRRIAEVGETETVELGRMTDVELDALVPGTAEPVVIGVLNQQLGGNRLLAAAFLGTVETDPGADLVGELGAWVERGSGHEELVRRFCRDELQFDLARAVVLLDGVAATRVALLGAVAEAADGPVLAALESLQARGVLVDVDGVLRVASPLLARLLATTTLPSRRHLWRGRAITWLQSLPPSGALDAEVAELHLAHAEPGDENAVACLLRAAAALETSQPSLVADYLHHVLRLVPELDPRVPSLELALARALLLDGQVREAQRVATAALPGLTEPGERARAHRIVAEALGTLGRQDPAMVAGIGDPGGPADHLVALQAHLAARIGDLGTAHDGIASVRESLAVSGYCGRLVTAVHLAHAEGMLAEYPAMLETIGQIADVVDAAPVPSRIVAHTNLAFLLSMHGDVRGAEHAAAAVALRSGAHLGLMRLELETAQLVGEFHGGQWDAALARIEQIRPDLEAAGSVAGLTLVDSIELGILVHRGQWSSARKIALDHHDDAASAALASWSAAAVDLHSGEAAAALDLLDGGLLRGAPPRFRHLLLVRAAEAEIVLGRTARARDHLRQVVPDRTLSPATSLTAIDALRLLGSLDGDEDLLAAAHAASLERQASFLQATTLLSLAGVRTDAEALLREAYERFHELGADPWRRRCAAELRARGHKVPRHRTPRPTGLTDVELQVARLVQLGRQNREIAAALSLSVKTVEAYLTRIYAKLECSSRLELARKLDQATEAETGRKQ